MEEALAGEVPGAAYLLAVQTVVPEAVARAPRPQAQPPPLHPHPEAPSPEDPERPSSREVPPLEVVLWVGVLWVVAPGEIRAAFLLPASPAAFPEDLLVVVLLAAVLLEEVHGVSLARQPLVAVLLGVPQEPCPAARTARPAVDPWVESPSGVVLGLRQGLLVALRAGVP